MVQASAGTGPDGPSPARRSPGRAVRRVLAGLVLVAAGACQSTTSAATPRSHETTGSHDNPVIVAAGDIACAPGSAVTATTCQQQATSDLVLSVNPTAVLTLGDEQYDEGRYPSFLKSYAPTWGRFVAITYPAPGNHEYYSKGAGYYRYFTSAKSAAGSLHPYYSFDLGSWHIIALNAECSYVGGCGFGSPEERWLAADLRTHPARCTLAFWHEPRFSSGGHGDDRQVAQFWTDLYNAGAEIVLNGHDHDYERFAPQTAYGKADPNHGIREFVVGTGGKSLRPFHKIKPNSQLRSDTFGVLALTLKPGGYTWRFLPIKGSTFTDSGSGTCHG